MFFFVGRSRISITSNGRMMYLRPRKKHMDYKIAKIMLE